MEDLLNQTLPPNPLKRLRSLEIELLEEAEKRQKLLEPINNKLYPSETPIVIDSSPLTQVEKDRVLFSFF
jgi:hypothetical protein